MDFTNNKDKDYIQYDDNKDIYVFFKSLLKGNFRNFPIKLEIKVKIF